MIQSASSSDSIQNVNRQYQRLAFKGSHAGSSAGLILETSVALKRRSTQVANSLRRVAHIRGLKSITRWNRTFRVIGVEGDSDNSF